MRRTCMKSLSCCSSQAIRLSFGNTLSALHTDFACSVPCDSFLSDPVFRNAKGRSRSFDVGKHCFSERTIPLTCCHLALVSSLPRPLCPGATCRNSKRASALNNQLPNTSASQQVLIVYAQAQIDGTDVDLHRVGVVKDEGTKI